MNAAYVLGNNSTAMRVASWRHGLGRKALSRITYQDCEHGSDKEHAVRHKDDETVAVETEDLERVMVRNRR